MLPPSPAFQESLVDRLASLLSRHTIIFPWGPKFISITCTAVLPGPSCISVHPTVTNPRYEIYIAVGWTYSEDGAKLAAPAGDIDHGP
ncbi:hypothetical protein K443DRAFT_680635 [Laccaria amethystina LaAM-08-1]|uniref:Uncharacterized protein n=1 Tax=Laccaria amethystina LaAM-08-1 TaxID=1095629 RepID=A0A0C9WMY0_9AGAR|nr:hypothetical protein K443DRAFT_680635 [Laccaria amethystina LaAM-08-1]